LGPLLLPWYIVLIVSIPETFFIVRLGFRLFNVDIDFNKVLILTLITAVLSVFIRKLPLAFGFHTLILTITLVLLCKAMLKMRLWNCFVSILVGVLILGVLESTLLPLFQSVTSTNTESLVIEPWLNVVYTFPLLIVMNILSLLSKRYNLVIFDLNLNED